MISESHLEHILKKDVWHELEIKAVFNAESSIYDLLRASIAANTLMPICLVQIADDGASVYGFNRDDVITWARLKGYSIPAEVAAVANMKPIESELHAKPWLIQNPQDPNPEQPWYVAARYFARQLVMGDSTLLTKSDLLAGKVADSLARMGIKKRGGKKPFNPTTIKKALSNVILG